jgi:hypothetical protein
MSEMVERVARAIAKRQGEIMLGADPATQTADPRALARAAIAAMREPTEAMKAVTSENTWHAVQDWQAMIDEALKSAS